MPKLRQPRNQQVEKEEVLEADANGRVLFEAEDPKVEVEDTDGADGADDVSTATGGEADDRSALLKQLEDMKASEAAARRAAEQAAAERDAAIKAANDRNAELHNTRTNLTDTRLDAVNAALTAANAAAEAAQRDIAHAESIGDVEAKAEAYRKLARAEANISRLEDGKAALEEEKKTAPREPQRMEQPSDGLDNTDLPARAKAWLRANPEYLRDPRKNAKIQALHWDILDEGHDAFSKDYFESLETHLGMREPPRRKEQIVNDEDDEDEQRDERTIVSAPVSRKSTPGSSVQTDPRKIKLTPAEAEAARMAGVTEQEYAKNKIRLDKLKKEGHYQ